MLENESLYKKCRLICTPSLLARVLSPLTASLRFDGALNVVVTEFLTV